MRERFLEIKTRFREWCNFYFRQVCTLLDPIFLLEFCFFFFYFFWRHFVFFPYYNNSDGGIFLWVRMTKRKDNPTVDNTHSKCVFCSWDKLQRPLNGSFFALAVLSFKTIARSGSFHIKSSDHFYFLLPSLFLSLLYPDLTTILYGTMQ